MILPLRYWIYIGLVVALVLGGNWALRHEYQRGIDYQKTEQAKADKAAALAHEQEKQKIETDARNKIAAADAAADRARANADGLRGQLTEIKRIAGNATGSFAPGKTARDAVVLLADLLRQCSDRYQHMANFADAAHNAGATCERSYDSLKQSPR